MSQEKVNKYKEEKAHRKVILKREKRNRILGRVIGGLICLALALWIGFSIEQNVTKNSPASHTDVNLDAIQDYLSGLDTSAAE